MEEAKESFNTCKKSDLVVNAGVFTSFIDGIVKVGRVEEAERLLERMSEIGGSLVRIAMVP